MLEELEDYVKLAVDSDRRERYLRDPLPARLGNLASNLSRINSLSNHSTMGEAAGKVVDESIFFIEWTAADASLRQQAELAELRRLLTSWCLEWHEIWNDLEMRTSVAEQAGAWSRKILESSVSFRRAGLDRLMI